MTTHRHALRLLFVVGLASGCDQPKPRCTIASGDFAVRYVYRTGNCEGLVGDLLSVQVYFDPRSEKDMSPDFEKVKVGLVPHALQGALGHAAGRATPDPMVSHVAMGAFNSSKPDGDDYCTIPALSPAHVRIPALPEQPDACGPLPAEPAVDEQYTFTDFRAYNAPGAYGTQLVAKLAYRNATCQGTYDVVGIYPALPCGSDPVADDAGSEDGGITLDGLDGGLGDIDGSIDATIPLDPDASLILPQEEGAEEPDCPAPEAEAAPQIPDDGVCGPGSGISPEFTATCDPVLLHCLIPNPPATP